MTADSPPRRRTSPRSNATRGPLSRDAWAGARTGPPGAPAHGAAYKSSEEALLHVSRPPCPDVDPMVEGPLVPRAKVGPNPGFRPMNALGEEDRRRRPRSGADLHLGGGPIDGRPNSLNGFSPLRPRPSGLPLATGHACSARVWCFHEPRASRGRVYHAAGGAVPCSSSYGRLSRAVRNPAVSPEASWWGSPAAAGSSMGTCSRRLPGAVEGARFVVGGPAFSQVARAFDSPTMSGIVAGPALPWSQGSGRAWLLPRVRPVWETLESFGGRRAGERCGTGEPRHPRTARRQFEGH